MASLSFFVRSKLGFLSSNGVSDREASAPGVDSGIRSDGISSIIITGFHTYLGNQRSRQQVKGERGLAGQGWRWYMVLPPMFHWPELSFKAKFTEREAGKCGAHVVLGERGNSSQLWHGCSLKHTSVESPARSNSKKP